MTQSRMHGRKEAESQPGHEVSDQTASPANTKDLQLELERLRRVEKQFKEITENFPSGGIVILDRDLNVTFVSGRDMKTLGHSREMFLGKKPAAILDPETVSLAMPRYEAAQRGEAQAFEMPFRGEYYMVHLTPILDQSGLVDHIVNISFNISDMKKAELQNQKNEQLYRKLAESFPNGMVIVFDLDLRVKYFAGQELIKRGVQGDQYLGKSVREISSPEDFTRIEPHLLKALQGEAVTYEVVSTVGDIYLSRVAPLLDEQGRVEKILLTSLNITEIRAVEKELQAALHKEKELHELKSRFITIVSHEFRTPLTSILSSSELIALLGDNLTPEKRGEYLDRIKRSVLRMNELLNNVLFLEKTQGKKLPFQPASTALLPLFEQIVKEIAVVHDHSHDIHLTHSALEGEIKVDVHLIEPIVINLLSNAIKYSAAGSRVHFDAAFRGEDLVLKIEDRGIGIPHSEQKNLFESFFRASNVGTIHGIGLGLSIVKECCEAHGGTIEVESEENRGTSFRVVIPVEMPVKHRLD